MVFLFWEMEVFSPKFKKFLIYSSLCWDMERFKKTSFSKWNLLASSWKNKCSYIF